MELRRIGADEGLACREVRLRALLAAPEAYHTPWGQEAMYPDSTWHELAFTCSDAMEQALFVLDRGDGDLAGTVYVRVNETPPHDAFIGGMWVDEDLRALGWADQLLSAAERFAYRLGSQSAELWVNEANARGRRFYERHGFVDSGISERVPASVNALVPYERTALMYRKPIL